MISSLLKISPSTDLLPIGLESPGPRPPLLPVSTNRPHHRAQYVPAAPLARTLNHSRCSLTASAAAVGRAGRSEECAALVGCVVLDLRRGDRGGRRRGVDGGAARALPGAAHDAMRFRARDRARPLAHVPDARALQGAGRTRTGDALQRG